MKKLTMLIGILIASISTTFSASLFDYDGDKKADITVYDQSTGMWYIESVAGKAIAFNKQFGGPDYTSVAGDFDGDGVNDLAVYNQNTGFWYIMTISGKVLKWAFQHGGYDMVPVPSDYDGDGVTDLAVYSPNQGKWYIITMSGKIIAYPLLWGSPNLLPVRAYPKPMVLGNVDPHLMVAIGDSITAGAGLSYQDTIEYQLTFKLGKMVINQGVGGERSNGGVARIQSIVGWYRPSTVIILYGINDLQTFVGQDVILANLKILIQYSKSKNAIPIICTLTPVTYNKFGHLIPSVISLNQKIRSLAKSENIGCVDYEAVFQWNASYFPDGIHPNAAGAKLMSDALYNALK